jgi:hypothetical protein
VKVIVFLNIFLAVLSLAFSNEFLMFNSYILYGIQFFIAIGYIVYKVRYLHYFLLPSIFMLVYFLLNLTIGSYLGPRGFGWMKEFSYSLLDIRGYNIIVFYMLIINTILVYLSLLFIEKCNLVNNKKAPVVFPPLNIELLFKTALLFCLFLSVTILDVFAKFAFQMAIIVVHVSTCSYRSFSLRLMTYLFYILMMVSFNFDSKREVILVFLYAFLAESILLNKVFRIRVGTVLLFVTAIVLFFVLILSSSILRGYGSYGATTFIDALIFIPDYISSDAFADSLTDNLEAAYNYAVSVIAIDFVMESKIDCQYGLTLVKFIFLPLPREVFDFKPESLIMIFTKTYDPKFYSIGGSYPVVFSSEMFVNFHYFGLVSFFAFMYMFNSFYISMLSHKVGTFKYLIFSYLVIMFFIVIRGSGLELYVLNFLAALLVFTVFKFPSFILRRRGL